MQKLKGYQISDFNNDGALKVPMLLWLVLAYLSRHLLLLAMGGLSTFMMSRTGNGQIDFAGFNSSPMFLLASLPAVTVMVAALLRAPGSIRLIQFIWGHGRKLLIVSALVDLGLLAMSCYLHWLVLNEWVIVGALLDIYILVYLLRSVRVRDTFSDFPE